MPSLHNRQISTRQCSRLTPAYGRFTIQTVSIFDRLKKHPEIWEQNGKVFRLLKNGGTQIFIPRLPKDLGVVKALVVDLNKAESGRGEFPEMAAETAKEDLIGLIKPPEISYSPTR